MLLLHPKPRAFGALLMLRARAEEKEKETAEEEEDEGKIQEYDTMGVKCI